MTRKQREIVNRMVDALLDIEPARRAAALEVLCKGIDAGDDAPLLRTEAERLLAADESIATRLAEFGAMRTRTGETVHGLTAPIDATGAELASMPAIVGRYHIRSLLGRGGMGLVFRAEQRAPIRREVALKLIRAGFETHAIVARFEAERQALSRMDHPNVARVLDAGLSDEGRPFFAMELVNGKPITEFADEHRLTVRQRLELFAQVCDAVAHAHTKGVIHRDIKPSNVLAYTSDDATPAVKVIDFGVAKAVVGDRAGRLGDSGALTDPGLTVGTVEYMSPEQAAMSADIDTRTDVYSLGVLLYELLVGSRPFERNAEAVVPTDEIRRRVREDDAPRPGARLVSASASVAEVRGTQLPDLIRTLRRELEWIPMMALRKERHRRYASPAEMAVDVRNYLSNRPLIAAPESRAYRFRKFVASHRTGIAVASVALLLLVSGTVGTTLGMFRAQAAREQADVNERRAVRSGYRSAVVAAEVALRNGDSIRLREALAAAPLQLRGWEWNYLNSAGTTVIATLEREPTDHFRITATLPDNRRAISASDSATGSAVLWDLRTGKILRREPGGQIAIDRAGRWLAIVRPDGSLDLCDLETGEPRWHAPAPSTGKPWRLYDASFSPDADQFVAWDQSATTLHLFDCATGSAVPLKPAVPVQRVIGFLKPGAEPARVAFTTDGSPGTMLLDPLTGITQRDPRIMHAIADQPLGEVRENVWAPLNWIGESRPEFDFEDESLALWTSVYLPHRRLIVSGRGDGSIDLIPAQTPGGAARGPRKQRYVVGPDQVARVTRTPDESRVIVTLASGEVSVVPIDASPEVSVPMPSVSVTAIAPDQTRLVGVGWGNVQCIDLLTGLPLWGRNLGPADNRHVAWSPDSSRVIVLSDARTDGLSDVFVLDATTGEQIAAWCDSPTVRDPVRAGRTLPWAKNVAGAAFDPGSTTLLVGHEDGTLSRVSTSDWSALSSASDESPWQATARSGDPCFSVLHRSPDAKWLAQLTVQRQDRTVLTGPITVRDMQTGRITRRIDLPGMGATTLAWSPTADRLVASFSDGQDTRVIVIDPSSGTVLLNHATGTASSLRAICFTHDGNRIIAANQAGRLTVMDAFTGEEILSPFQPRVMFDATYTADGAIAVSGSGLLLRRLESRKFTDLLPEFAGRWPDGVPASATVDEARRRIAIATEALQKGYQSALPWDQYMARLAQTDRGTAELVRALQPRFPANINLLNSEALSILFAASPSDESLARACEMLAKAVAIKPHSANLNGNLGSALFARGQFAECITRLDESERLRAERGLTPAVGNLLRLAIACRSINDPQAADRARRARQAVAEQSLGDDPEVRSLLQELHRRGAS
jgi:WD40 repeat protein